MDSSGLQRSISTSVLSNCRSKKEASAMVQSRRAEFFATYQLQEFSLPDSIMFYIAKNPPSPKLYKKIIQTCKYFFVKNPIIVVSEFIYYGGDKWELPCRKRRSGLSKILSNLWITDRLYVHSGYSVERMEGYQNIFPCIMPKLYQCDAKTVFIENQIISNVDLSLLISSAEIIDFYDVTVRNKDGSDVAVEKIVENALKAKNIKILSERIRNITSKTMKELLNIPNFLKLDRLTFYGIPETFDLETYYVYMKQNTTTKVYLHFHDSVSEAYQNRLEEIIDEILATETRDYKVPLIRFHGRNIEKRRKLERIFSSR